MTVKDLGFKPMQLINLFLVETVGDQLVQAKTFNEICNFKVCALADDRVLAFREAIVTIYEIGKELYTLTNTIRTRNNKYQRVIKKDVDELSIHEMHKDAMNMACDGLHRLGVNYATQYVHFFSYIYDYPCCIDCLLAILSSPPTLGATRNLERRDCNSHRLYCGMCTDYFDRLEVRTIKYCNSTHTVSICRSCRLVIDGSSYDDAEILLKARSIRKDFRTITHGVNLKRIQIHSEKRHMKHCSSYIR